MINQLGSNTMAMGSTTPDIDTYVSELTGAAANSQDETTQEAADLTNDIAENLVSMGMAMEILGEEYETRFAMVYEEGDDAETGPYEDMIELIEENNTSEVEQPLENVEVSKNGRTIMVTTTGETETLFENAQESASGSASASGSGSSSDGGGGDDTDYAIGFPVDVATMQVVSLGDIVGAPLSEGGVDVGV